MPYRIDLTNPPPEALDVLVQLGALDVESNGLELAALMPDAIAPEELASELNAAGLRVSPALARDGNSVWLLSPRTVRIGSLLIAPPDADAPSNALRLNDAQAFGSGHHPTTAMCIESLEEMLSMEPVPTLLDVGTGSGILALAALTLGVPRSVGIDIDHDALAIAAENARLNHLSDRLQLVPGGPGDVSGVWPLVVANILAAPLIEMAPVLVRRVASRGHLILSGIPPSVESEVREAYKHRGMKHTASKEQGGWVTLIVRASW